MKTLLLAVDCSVMDDVISVPPTYEPHDLGELLDRVAERLDDDGVLILSGPWARYVQPFWEQGGTERPVTLHAGDWHAGVMEGDAWIRWTHADRHTIWTCDNDRLPPGGRNSPLIADQPMLTALNMAQWVKVTGVPWVGTPGMAGNALLVDGWEQMNPKAPAPRWNTSGVYLPHAAAQGDRWIYGHIEQAYTPRQWSRPSMDAVHGFDLNKAYLSAYSVIELPTAPLERHRHPDRAQTFDPKEGGIWRVELSPWNYGHLLPDPAGYAPELDDGTRWLTTPTLTLLQQLTDRGDYGGFTIREAWTAPTRRITRKWAELINDMVGAAREPLNYAAKQLYKQTWGMWANPGRVHRPDWHYSIIAQSRANLWRKIDTGMRSDAHGTHRTLSAVSPEEAAYAPVRVETDCVFYPDLNDTWEWVGQTNRFRLDPSGIKLGHFKPYEPKGER